MLAERNLHVERPMRLGGRTYCACGSPWPCQHAGPFEVVVTIGGRVDERSHAYDGNPEGRTICGLYPDNLTARRAWRIVPFTRCSKCEAALSPSGVGGSDG